MSFWIEFHHNVDVAVGGRFAPGLRAEQGGVLHAFTSQLRLGALERGEDVIFSHMLSAPSNLYHIAAWLRGVRLQDFWKEALRVTALTMTTLVGFDSAWVDNERTPGAVCALVFDASGGQRFEAPSLVGFDRAAELIENLHNAESRTLVAIDQPTIVPNATGMRPCEKVVASVASWSGGGIQPANREGQGKVAMFGDHAPIWRFLKRLDFIDHPEQARSASRGGYVMEVFPALALLDFDPLFAAPKAGPRYNPARRKTFRLDAWRAVCDAATGIAERFGFAEVAGWCRDLERSVRPCKSSQDSLDSVICLLVGACWLCDRERCAMIGDLTDGYIVAPVGPEVRARLVTAAGKVAADLKLDVAVI